jgi:hypothetical protein
MFPRQRKTRNNPLLDNSSVSTFQRQRIDAVKDELFEIVIYVKFASELQKEGSVQFRKFNLSAFARGFNVQLWSVNQRTTEAEEVADS